MTVFIHELLPEGKCAICNKNMQTRRTKCGASNEGGLNEVLIKNNHSKCETLVSKKKKLLRRLLNIEFQIFAFKND